MRKLIYVDGKYAKESYEDRTMNGDEAEKSLRKKKEKEKVNDMTWEIEWWVVLENDEKKKKKIHRIYETKK